MTRNQWFSSYYNILLNDLKKELECFAITGDDQFGNPEAELSREIYNRLRFLEWQFNEAVIKNKKSGSPFTDFYYANKSEIDRQKYVVAMTFNFSYS